MTRFAPSRAFRNCCDAPTTHFEKSSEHKNPFHERTKKLASALRLVDTAPASSTDALKTPQQLYDQLPSEEDKRAIDELQW